eukprot:10132372-Alexandrium_andersonii.AAC.1
MPTARELPLAGRGTSTSWAATRSGARPTRAPRPCPALARSSDQRRADCGPWRPPATAESR